MPTRSTRAAILAAGFAMSCGGGSTDVEEPRGTVSTPTFTPSLPLHFREQLEVTLGTATADATIHYTTDGAAPTATSPAYRGPLALSATTRLRAIAVADGMNTSAERELTYTRQAVDLVLDDGTLDAGIGIDTGGAGLAMLTNRFTPPADALPFELTTVSVLFREYDTVGAPFRLVVYSDANGNPADGAVVMTTAYVTVLHADEVTWSTYTLPEPLLVTEPADLVVGILSTAPSCAADTTAAARRSLGFVWNAAGSAPALPADQITDFGAVGYNFMIRTAN